MIISIIIPVYNASQYIHRCVESLVNQTYRDIEIILVDDGSTDDSLSLCREWAEKDSRIRVYSQSNSGVSVARNAGIKSAQGDFIILLDSDDWLDITTCQKLLEIQAESQADCIVYGLTQTSGNIWAPAEHKMYETLDDLKEDFLYQLNTELLSSSVNKLYKKEYIKSLYPEDMSFGEDLLFSLDYLDECQKIIFIKEAFYQHEVYNTSSLTHTFNTQRFRDIERIQRRIMDFATDKSDVRLYQKYTNDCIRIIRSFLLSDATYKEKRSMLKNWLRNAYLRNLPLGKIQLIWQNRILLELVQKGCYPLAYALVNWKKVFNKG